MVQISVSLENIEICAVVAYVTAAAGRESDVEGVVFVLLLLFWCFVFVADADADAAAADDDDDDDDDDVVVVVVVEKIKLFQPWYHVKPYFMIPRFYIR